VLRKKKIKIQFFFTSRQDRDVYLTKKMAWRRVKNCDTNSYDFAVRAIKLLSEAQETVDGVTQLVKKEANSVNATSCALNALANLGEQAKIVMEYYPQTYMPNRDMPIDVDNNDLVEHNSPKKKHHRHYHSSKRARVYDSISSIGSSRSGSYTFSTSSIGSTSSDSSGSSGSSGSSVSSGSSGSSRSGSYTFSTSSSGGSGSTSSSSGSSGSSGSSKSCRRAEENRRENVLAMLHDIINQSTGLPPIYIPENASNAALETLLMTCRAMMVQQQQQLRSANPSYEKRRKYAKKQQSCKRQMERESCKWDSMSSTDSASSLEHLQSKIQQKRAQQIGKIKENKKEIMQIIGEEFLAKMDGVQTENTFTANIWSRISAKTGIPIEVLQVLIDVEMKVPHRRCQDEKVQETPIQRLIEDVGQLLLNQSDKDRELQLVQEVENLVKKADEEVRKPIETAARDMFALASSDEDDESGSQKATVTDWKLQ
jgi:hypothetical protein